MSATTPPPATPSPTPPPAPKVKTKFNRRAIERRRLEMWEMVCCGASNDDIATRMKVSHKTVERDRRWWKDHLGGNTTGLKNEPHKAAIDVGTTAAKLNKIAEDASVDYLSSSNGVIKVRCQQVIIAALGLRHKILAEAGFLPKVGHEKETAPSVQINFNQKFGADAAALDDPKSRRKVLEAAFSVIKAGLTDDKGVLGLPLEGHGSPIEDTMDPDPGDAPAMGNLSGD